jgi:hypothetical protein
LSEPTELAAYRLPQAGLRAGPRTVEFVASRDGRCLGVVQWIRIDLDEVESFANDPREDIGRMSSGWQHMLYTVTRPFPVKAGERVRFQVEETPGRLLVDRLE